MEEGGEEREEGEKRDSLTMCNVLTDVSTSTPQSWIKAINLVFDKILSRTIWEFSRRL